MKLWEDKDHFYISKKANSLLWKYKWNGNAIGLYLLYPGWKCGSAGYNFSSQNCSKYSSSMCSNAFGFLHFNSINFVIIVLLSRVVHGESGGQIGDFFWLKSEPINQKTSSNLWESSVDFFPPFRSYSFHVPKTLPTSLYHLQVCFSITTPKQ